HAIGSIRFFRIPVPKGFFTKGYRRELGIGADRSHTDKLFDPAAARLFDRVDPHDGVVMEKAAGVFAVCADPAHYGGEMNKDIGARVPKETGNVALYTQVILRTARQKELLTTALAKLLRH